VRSAAGGIATVPGIGTANSFEDTTMIAKTQNGVNHDGLERHGPPTKNGVPATAAPPSTDGGNGASAATAPPSTDGGNGRDKHGRFTAGNAGGPGNPFARQTAALRRELCQTVTGEDVKAVTLRLIEQAKGGDVAAARLLFAYAIGSPAEAVNPDTLDAQEWQNHRQMAVPFAEVDSMVWNVPADVACRLAQGWLPQHSTIVSQEAKQVLNGETPAQKKKRRRAERRARSRAASGTQHGPIDSDIPVYVRRMREDWPR
jgi:hypothetical protein